MHFTRKVTRQNHRQTKRSGHMQRPSVTHMDGAEERLDTHFRPDSTAAQAEESPHQFPCLWKNITCQWLCQQEVDPLFTLFEQVHMLLPEDTGVCIGGTPYIDT